MVTSVSLGAPQGARFGSIMQNSRRDSQKNAGPRATDQLSEADLELINALQIAPRVTWQDAGRILGVRPATLAARWERIESEGLAWITCYGVGDPT